MLTTGLSERSLKFLDLVGVNPKDIQWFPIIKAYAVEIELTPAQCRKIKEEGYLNQNRKRTDSALTAIRTAIQNNFIPIFDPIALTIDGFIGNGGHRIELRAELSTNEKAGFILQVEVSLEQLAAYDANKRRSPWDQYKLIRKISVSKAEKYIISASNFIFYGNADCQNAKTLFDIDKWFDILEYNEIGETTQTFVNTWCNYTKGRKLTRFEGIIDVFYKLWLMFGEDIGDKVLAQFFAVTNKSNKYTNIYDTFYGIKNEYFITTEGKRCSETHRRLKLVKELSKIDKKFSILLNNYIS